jgi:hypothetical protein
MEEIQEKYEEVNRRKGKNIVRRTPKKCGDEIVE